MASTGGPELLAGPGDDIVTIDDAGDVYGAFFGNERARASQTVAQLRLIASGPLLARAEAVIMLGGQPLTKTVTLRADSPLVEMEIQVAALPETTTIVQVPTTRQTALRTDDLGFAAFTHPFDNSPIVSGTITYRREVFYPIMAWGAVSADGVGLALITHGLQGLGGTSTLNLMLLRQVSDGGRPNSEGLTERGYQTLRYAYLPYAGGANAAQIARAAAAFNQPLIAAWRAAAHVQVQLPFMAGGSRSLTISPTARPLPPSFSLLSADHGMVVDLYRRGDRVEAVIINLDPPLPVILTSDAQQFTSPPGALNVMRVELTYAE